MVQAALLRESDILNLSRTLSKLHRFSISQPLTILFMTLLPSLSFALLAFSATTPLSAQTAAKEKLQLKDDAADDKPKINLDPTGKLPSANKDDALVPLDSGAAATPQELPPALKSLSASKVTRVLTFFPP